MTQDYYRYDDAGYRYVGIRQRLRPIHFCYALGVVVVVQLVWIDYLVGVGYVRHPPELMYNGRPVFGLMLSKYPTLWKSKPPVSTWHLPTVKGWGGLRGKQK